jgi:phosphoribosyl-ATP pyrophosphohydrolase/phosphoribosyl-AMP cyclohydrolase
MSRPLDPAQLAWDESGLVTGVVQDARTRRVLMVAWLDREALERTLATGKAHFWSRSRRRLWMKGETSGNVLAVDSIETDCDADTLLLRVIPAGPACHTGARSCFDAEAGVEDEGFAALESLWAVIAARAVARTPGSYTARLLDGGPDLPARKLVEEATEVLMAAKDHAAGTAADRRLAEEMADLVYHLLVVGADRGVAPRQVLAVLAERAGGRPAAGSGPSPLPSGDGGS